MPLVFVNHENSALLLKVNKKSRNIRYSRRRLTDSAE